MDGRMTDLKAGDIVRLKTGFGPQMVVEGKADFDATKVMCWWFDARSQLQGYAINPELLYRLPKQVLG
jgi:uncharacterized protein YodC (DUF2158 family)